MSTTTLPEPSLMPSRSDAHIMRSKAPGIRVTAACAKVAMQVVAIPSCRLAGSSADSLHNRHMGPDGLVRAGSVKANLRDMHERVEASEATFQGVLGVLDAATKRLQELQLEREVRQLHGSCGRSFTPMHVAGVMMGWGR